MTAFQENLVAEVIGLVAGLIVTYLIVDKLLRKQDRRTWEPARKRLLSALKGQCEAAFVGWANKAVGVRQRTLDMTNLTTETMEEIVTDLESEIAELSAVDAVKLFEHRPPDYWRNQIRSLSTIRESLRLAIDRLQVTLREEPGIVELIMDLEASYMSVPSLDEQLRQLDSLRQEDGSMNGITDHATRRLLAIGTVFVVGVYKNMLKTWRALADIPTPITRR